MEGAGSLQSFFPLTLHFVLCIVKLFVLQMLWTTLRHSGTNICMLITNDFLNLHHVSHLLKTRPSPTYLYNFTQYFNWYISFFIWGSKADRFWSPLRRRCLLFPFSATSVWKIMALLYISLLVPYKVYDSFSYYLSVLYVLIH